MQAILSGDISALSAGLSGNAQGFLSACLQRDPACRPSVCDLLMHPWMQVSPARHTLQHIVRGCPCVALPLERRHMSG